jgi:hypothetical protein
MGKEIIRFAERALMKISDVLEFSDEQYLIKVKGKKYRISEE